MIDAIITRLKDIVPTLRSVEGADGWERARSAGLPQQSPVAFVVPLGLQGGRVETDSAGVFTQGATETIGIILCLRTDGPADQALLQDLRGFINAVAAAIMGWAPDGYSSSFRLARGAVAAGSPGQLIYQIDLSTDMQFRVTT